MDIYCRYYGEMQFSGGATHPDGVTFINSKATLGDEAASRLCLEYPHKFRTQPWDAVDMIDARLTAPTTPVVSTPPTPSTPSTPVAPFVPVNGAQLADEQTLE